MILCDKNIFVEHFELSDNNIFKKHIQLCDNNIFKKYMQPCDNNVFKKHIEPGDNKTFMLCTSQKLLKKWHIFFNLLKEDFCKGPGLCPFPIE